MLTTAIIAAGGRGRRLGAAVPKQLLTIGGRPMLQMTVDAFAGHARVTDVVVVLPPDVAANPPDYLLRAGRRVRLVAGGERRQDSVANGLAAVDEETEIVLVHDAARPFVDAVLIDRAIDAAVESGAAICAVQASDTVKVADGRTTAGAATWIGETLSRELVFLAQTPQAFRRSVLADAVRLGQAGVAGTDEAFLAEQAGHRVRLVEGSARNIKITSAEDLALAQSWSAAGGLPGGGLPRLPIPDSDASCTVASSGGCDFRIGVGYDFHRLAEGRRLVLGGVDIPFDRGLLGHSDADALCHAITDAVLGACGAGDIGRHFPDDDERWRGASSIELLRRAVCIVRERGFAVHNVDAVVVAERPKLAPHIPAMAERLAGAMQVQVEDVSVKGKTSEGLGEIGRGEAVACHAVALLKKIC